MSTDMLHEILRKYENNTINFKHNSHIGHTEIEL